jgi:hypothetical protein
MINKLGQILRRCGKVPGQERRLGDLNPGWARTQTALAVPSALQKRSQPDPS